MRAQAKAWMVRRIKQGAKDGHGVFSIADFQTYLNDKLLIEWEVPKSTLPRRAQADDGHMSDYLTVSWSTARSWAVAIGASFQKHKKGYYVDGHDRPDVLEHRSEWLSTELKLELRQYLWVQMTVEQAVELNIPGYRTNEVEKASPSEKSCTSSSSRRRFQGLSKHRDRKKISAEQQEERERVVSLVEAELVYPYTTDDGTPMVEIHVDILPQKLRTLTSTKLTIHGVQFDMGGNLSVRFPTGESPIIKVGTDEIIFKVTVTHLNVRTCFNDDLAQMYAMNKSSWSVDGVVKLLRKTEGKGNMKIVYVCYSIRTLTSCYNMHYTLCHLYG